MKTAMSNGYHREAGRMIGRKLAGEIEHNAGLVAREGAALGLEGASLQQYSHEYKGTLSADSLEMMEGISLGSKLPFESIVTYNAMQDLLYADDCTLCAAAGKATASGNTLFLKNKDTRRAETREGMERMAWSTGISKKNIGERFFKGQIINVVQVLENPQGNVIVGASTAGSTGIKMGLNKHGVATGSNGVYSAGKYADGLFKGGFDGKTYSANSRPQLMREGLMYATAKEAVAHVLGRMVKDSAMSAPGMIWFLDPEDIFIIEGAFPHFAVRHVTDGIALTASRLVLLDHLMPEDEPWQQESASCRNSRVQEMLEENYGKITRETMIEISMDHKNGPGQNSICNHGQRSNTISASVIELDREAPETSKISLALGSPCWAWRSGGGNITVQMDKSTEKIPPGFLDGSVFKEFFKLEANEE